MVIEVRGRGQEFGREKGRVEVPGEDEGVDGHAYIAIRRNSAVY